MKQLTQAAVAQRVAKVARYADLDDDEARDNERELFIDVLVAAAEGQDVQALAQTALGTRSHVFGGHRTR